MIGFAASGEMTCPGLFQHPQDTFTLDKLQEKEQKILPVSKISTNISNIIRNSKSSQAGHVRGALFSHTYRCGNVNEEGVAIHTHYLQERVGDNVHDFTVPPHQEPPESKGNKPSICINRCGCYGHWKHNKRFNVLL